MSGYLLVGLFGFLSGAAVVGAIVRRLTLDDAYAAGWDDAHDHIDHR